MAKKATHYSETPIEKWNTAHFQAYLINQHVERYEIQYVSAGSIVAERNLIAKYIGTARKPGMYPTKVVKAFIDACFTQYKPTQQYPGLSFWFMTTYMTRLLQQAELASKRTEIEDNTEEVAEWL
ncbi:hypothetical protein ACQKNX_24535 [Lysinibacillus sp. NPDC093712]|uniref:hypothetical protein n=1 Tax=Lysinibacillus sp. NPDC093712 TaxID=3390579 RepID=UPI003D08C34E